MQRWIHSRERMLWLQTAVLYGCETVGCNTSSTTERNRKKRLWITVEEFERFQRFPRVDVEVEFVSRICFAVSERQTTQKRERAARKMEKQVLERQRFHPTCRRPLERVIPHDKRFSARTRSQRHSQRSRRSATTSDGNRGGAVAEPI